MKKTLILLITIILLSSISASAKSGSKSQIKFQNISFISQERYNYENGRFDSKYGASVTTGKTFFLHNKAIGKVLKFGIDASWLDIGYTNYIVNDYYYSPRSAGKTSYPDMGINKSHYNPSTMHIHQVDISMQVGLSLNINPVDKFNIQPYFRYVPTYSSIFYNGNFIGGYATNFATGGTISYGVIGIGAEYRFGGGYLRSYRQPYENQKYITKYEFSGMRYYLSFRF